MRATHPILWTMLVLFLQTAVAVVGMQSGIGVSCHSHDATHCGRDHVVSSTVETASADYDVHVEHACSQGGDTAACDSGVMLSNFLDFGWHSHHCCMHRHTTPAVPVVTRAGAPIGADPVDVTPPALSWSMVWQPAPLRSVLAGGMERTPPPGVRTTRLII